VYGTQRQIADELLLVDQARTDQQAQAVGVRALAQQPLREGRAEDIHQTLS
jgi:hypothetical protein